MGCCEQQTEQPQHKTRGGSTCQCPAVHARAWFGRRSVRSGFAAEMKTVDVSSRSFVTSSAIFCFLLCDVKKAFSPLFFTYLHCYIWSDGVFSNPHHPWGWSRGTLIIIIWPSRQDPSAPSYPSPPVSRTHSRKTGFHSLPSGWLRRKEADRPRCCRPASFSAQTETR